MKAITIIGGGLSGLGLASGLLKHGVPVKVIEAGTYPRHRVCGEFLTSLRNDTLNQLGIEGCLDDALLHRSTTWYKHGRRIKSFNLPVPARGISRFYLDSWLVNHIRQNGGEVVEGKRAKPQTSEGVIIACGRRPGSNGMTGLKAHWSGIDLHDDLEVHLGKHAYVGLSAVEDGYVNVCGVFREIAKGSFARPELRFLRTLELCGCGALADRLRSGGMRDGSFCSVTGLDYSGGQASGIGDQRTLIPPYTGNGMTIALESAQVVLPLILQYAGGSITWQDYLAKADSALQQRFRKRLFHARWLHPMILNPSAQSLVKIAASIGAVPFAMLYQLTHC